MFGEFKEKIPTELYANLDYREEIIAIAGESEKNKCELWQACSRDMHFWLNTFGWTFNPQLKTDPVLPFITWPAQDDYLKMLDDCIGVEDCGVKKSREEGATWLTLAIFTWHLLFRRDEAFLIVSRKEKLVDNAEDPDSLFWKIRFLINNQPGFLRPRMSRQKHMYLKNLETQTTIVGESTTGDIGIGGRKTAMLLDEFSMFALKDGFNVLKGTADVTRCRIFVATPITVADAYAEVILRRPKMRKISLMWYDDPRKNPGLYTTDDGKPRILDESHKFPPDYPFILDGKKRSPWFDFEWHRRGDPRYMAQSVECNFSAASYEFFPPEVMEEYEKELSRNPWHEFELMTSNDTNEVIGINEKEDGACKVWHNFEADEKGNQIPPPDDYVIAADIAQGTGATNTVITIGHKNKDGKAEKIFEYADPRISSIAAARIMVALARFYQSKTGRPAFMIWEATGPGQPFGIEVVRCGFNNFYSKRQDKRVDSPETDQPGFYMTPDNKQTIFDALKFAWCTRTYIDPSRDCLREARMYVFDKGSIEHSGALGSQDPSGARKNHGDRVVASALLNYALAVEYRPSVPVPTEKQIPHNCMASRRAAAAAEERKPKFRTVFS